MRQFLLVFSIILLPLISVSNAAAEDAVYTGVFSNKAVGGYDTVAFFTQGKPVKGEKKHHTRYMGADWYFASRENLEMFKAMPQQYAPQYGGYCAWAVAAKNDFAPGDPEHWAIVDGKLYLNYNQKIQQRWSKDIPGFITAADKNWPSLISSQ